LPRERLAAVSIMCGFAPLDADRSYKGIFTRILIDALWPIIPTLVRFMFQGAPIGRVDLTDEERLRLLMRQVDSIKPTNAAQKLECEAMRDEEANMRVLRSCREAFSQGLTKPGFDGRLPGGRYGFRIEDIRPDLPFQLWYGSIDTMTPIRHGRLIAQRLGTRATLHVSEDTHGSLQVRFQKDAWKALLDVS